MSQREFGYTLTKNQAVSCWKVSQPHVCIACVCLVAVFLPKGEDVSFTAVEVGRVGGEGVSVVIQGRG